MFNRWLHDLPFTSNLVFCPDDKIRFPSQIFFRSRPLLAAQPSDSLCRLTFRTAPYRSPKFHVTRPGPRSTRQRLHATRKAPKESDELAFYRRLHSYRDRDDASHRPQSGLEDEEDDEWADESTLIAMLQDKYVSSLIPCVLQSCWTRYTSQRSTRGRRL